MRWFLGILLACLAFADEQKDESKIKYKAGKEIDFEQLLIQGQLKRPEIAVVTGNADQGVDGLLRLREDFLDHISVAQGQELK